MNPSAQGWIKKHLPYFVSNVLPTIDSQEGIYMRFRESGFIYGSSITTLSDTNRSGLRWTMEEKTKVNLLDALCIVYYDTFENPSPEDAVQCIVDFYKRLNNKQEAFWHINLSGKKPFDALEKVIHQRISTNASALQKNFSHLITNALLYLDVLTFEAFLLTDTDPFQYASAFEKLIINVIWLALLQKEAHTLHDELLIKLFESSLRYNSTIKSTSKELKEIDFSILHDPLEATYLLDLASMAIWDDNQLDLNEVDFMKNLAQEVALERQGALDSIHLTHQFISQNKDKIAYLNYSNPVKHFYKHTTLTVSNLILRNKTRLIKELRLSKDLLVLLGHSTHRELNKEEKKIVKRQLLDICKSVPSLAIFLLPGGSLLMPLLIKFIPQLLPSAFNENLE